MQHDHWKCVGEVIPGQYFLIQGSMEKLKTMNIVKYEHLWLHLLYRQDICHK